MRKAVNCNDSIQHSLVKEELEWDDESGVSEAAACAGLYVKHEVKRELVLGPELLQPQDIVYKLLRKPELLVKTEKERKKKVKKEQAPQSGANEPILDARCIAQLLTICHVPLHRLPDTIHPQRIQQNVTKERNHTDTNNRHVLDDYSNSAEELNKESKDGNHCKDSLEKIAEIPVCKENVKSTAGAVRVERKKKAIGRKLKGSKKYKCQACGEEFTAKKKLKAHASVHRVKKTKQKLNKGKYACDACGRKFVDKKKLLFHMLVHMGQRPYKCGTCSSQFTCQSRLDKHERSHTGERKYTCDMCGKRYSEKHTLTRHILVHMSGKIHTCEICDKQFSCLEYLERHNALHSDVKSYACEICKQQFRWRSILIQHKRIHTGLKDICEICGKCFARKTGLKRHYLIHKGVKPYPCQYCKKKFRTKWASRRHTSRVHGYKNGNLSGNPKTSLEEIRTVMTPDISGTRENQPSVNGEAQPHETARNNTEYTNTESGLATNILPITEKAQTLSDFKENSVNINLQSLKDPPLANTEKTRNIYESNEELSYPITNDTPLLLRVPADPEDTKKSEPETSQVDPKNAIDLCESKKDPPAKNNETQTSLDNLEQLDKNLDSCENTSNKGHPVKALSSHINTLDNSESGEREASVHSELNLEVQSEASPTCDEIIDLISNLANGTQQTQIKIEYSDEFLELSKPYSCDTCGKRYGEKKFLITHCRAHMEKNTCDICNKSYTYVSYLERHMKTHTEKRKFTCDVCGLELSSLCSLLRHESVHTTERRHRCNICKKRFKQLSDLRKHLRTHTGEKPYKCDICGLGFGTQGNMKRHKQVHESTKPYPCDLCGKRFTSRAYALLHSKIHTGEKSYTCDVCDRQFLYRYSYLNHKQLHNGPREKQFSCEECGAKFTTSGHRKRHMMIHTGSKRFSCELCDKRFYTKSDLEKHTKNQKRPCVD